MQEICSRPLLGSRPWSKNDPWSLGAHPWMTAYCGFFALEMKRRFPELAFALEYCLDLDDRESGLIADHALVHDGDRFYDSRGLLVGYEPLDEDDICTVTYLEAEDLRLSGLLLPYPGLRDLPEAEVTLRASEWIENNGFSDLKTIPLYSYQA